MREQPYLQSKVVSQSLLSEGVEIKDEAKGWSYIITSDDYAGWVESSSLVQLNTPFHGNLKISRLAAHLYREPNTEYGPAYTLPYGCWLEAKEDIDPRWIKAAIPFGEVFYIQRGDVAPEPPLLSQTDLVQFSLKFLGLPYTWGGRSSFGFDCSGFIQMLYNKIGISLKRDSRLQIQDDRFQSISIQDLEPGDLIFFGKSEKAISHVAMSLGNHRFIHATAREFQPWLRISHLSDFEWSGHANAYYPYRVGRKLLIHQETGAQQ